MYFNDLWNAFLDALFDHFEGLKDAHTRYVPDCYRVSLLIHFVSIYSLACSF